MKGGAKSLKTKHLFTVIIALLLIFVLIVGFMPNFIESKSIYDSYSYKSQILNKNSITEVYVEIGEDDFQSMLDDPTAEDEKEANVVINGYRVDNVSIRTKGNSSLTSVASDSESDRYSFKIDFEAYNDQNLLGMTKLNLNNCYTDPSYMREYISYCLMEEMGVPTPAFAYTRVYINGDLWGLYLGVEQINSTFINSNFSVVDGDLYKPDGLSLKLEDGQTAQEYIEENEEALSLKTNKGTSKYTALENLIEVINNGGDLESVMNVDEVIRYFAANTALVNMDSYVSNMFHNYYIYEEDGVFSMIPWDFDLSMGVFSMGMGGMGGRGNGQDAPGQFTSQNTTSENVSDESISSLESALESNKTSIPTNEDALSFENIPEGFTPPNGTEFPKGDSGTPPSSGQNLTTPPTKEESSTSNVTSSIESTPESTSSTDTIPNQMAPPSMFGGENGKGGGMGSQTIKFTDNSINFPIDTSVSGYDLPSYPLINSWIENSEYKEIYHEYLREIATGFFSKSRIQKLMGDTMNMISKDVANDPNAKSTVEEFQTEAQNIIDFCVQRGESILGQLDGTISSTKESTGAVTAMGGGMGGGGMPNMDDEAMQEMFQNFQNGNLPADGNIPGVTAQDATSSEISADVISESESFSNQNPRGNFQPGGDNTNGVNMPPNRGAGGMMRPGGSSQQTTTYTSGNIAAYIISGVALLFALIFAFIFKRRGHKKSIS